MNEDATQMFAAIMLVTALISLTLNGILLNKLDKKRSGAVSQAAADVVREVMTGYQEIHIKRLAEETERFQARNVELAIKVAGLEKCAGEVAKIRSKETGR